MRSFLGSDVNELRSDNGLVTSGGEIRLGELGKSLGVCEKMARQRLDRARFILKTTDRNLYLQKTFSRCSRVKANCKIWVSLRAAADCRLVMVSSAVAKTAEARVIKMDDRILKECIKLNLKG